MNSLISKLDSLSINLVQSIQFITTNKKQLASNFKKAINGYHMLSKEPLKESKWEEINTQILDKSNCTVLDTVSGSHQSGCDLKTSRLGNLSNKTSKIQNNKFSMSSYRLTTVCDINKPGNIPDILAEINKRSASYENYSLLLRDHINDTTIKYKWYILPKTLSIIDPNKYKWNVMIGKQGKNKGLQVGWITNTVNGCSMKITFSMSSQLWITTSLANPILNKYLVDEVIYDFEKSKQLDFIDLYNLLNSEVAPDVVPDVVPDVAQTTTKTPS